LATTIKLFGHSGITNVDKTESAHVELKEDYGHSSKHLGNFKELINMNRIKKITTDIISKHYNNTMKSKGTNHEISNNNTHDTIYIPNLGYVEIRIKRIGNEQYEWLPIFNGNSMLPIHPMLNINTLKQLFLSNLKDPNKAISEGWKEIGLECLRGVSKCSLLKGVKLMYHGKNCIIYAKRDHYVKSAPGINSGNIVRDRFNFVEVRIYI
jgi:hypothetical protein